MNNTQPSTGLNVLADVVAAVRNSAGIEVGAPPLTSTGLHVLAEVLRVPAQFAASQQKVCQRQHFYADDYVSKDDLRDIVLEWPEGCESGKYKFLASLGIEVEPVTVTVTIELTLARYDHDGDRTDEGTVARHVAEAAENIEVYGVTPENVAVLDVSLND